MITRTQLTQAQERAAQMLSRAGIVLAPEERDNIEVADFGLGELDEVGLQIVTYVNTDRYCAKELVLFPRQTCPEHRHPPAADDPGKMESFRCRWGKAWLYTEGDPVSSPAARLPTGGEDHYTVFREIELTPGAQCTVLPGTLHWFQASDEGAILSTFSSTSRDRGDVFTDPRIERVTKIAEP